VVGSGAGATRQVTTGGPSVASETMNQASQPAAATQLVGTDSCSMYIEKLGPSRHLLSFQPFLFPICSFD
jgi:hypothetical protein